MISFNDVMRNICLMRVKKIKYTAVIDIVKNIIKILYLLRNIDIVPYCKYF